MSIARPIYETREHLRGEDAAIKAFSAYWPCEVRKLATSYRLDFAAFDEGRLVAFVEVKRRSITLEAADRLGGYMLSLGKYVAARQLCETAGVMFVLLVDFADGIRFGYFDAFPPFPIGFMGRKDRGDWQDLEPCVLIPGAFFEYEVPR